MSEQDTTPPLNLKWLNMNPNPTNICNLCLPMIGTVWAPGTEITLPLHGACYCTYWPTEDPVTEIDWDALAPEQRIDWIHYVAWMLRTSILLSIILEPLRQAAEQYNQEREDDEMPEENQPPAGQHTVHAYAGQLRLQADILHPRASYECTFMRPGLVVRADGSPSNWLIPAEVIRTAAPQFNALSCYVDHPLEYGFWGDRQEPQVKNLAGVTFDARWDQERNALVGSIRLYDQDPNSPGSLIRALLDQILADEAAGREVPAIGLSAVFYQKSMFDQEAGVHITTEIVKPESIDFVYGAGAGGYVRAALASIRGDLPPLYPGHELVALDGALAPDTGGTNMPEERTPDQGPAPDPVVVDAPAPSAPSIESRIDSLTDTVAALTAQLAAQLEPITIVDMGNPPRSRISIGPTGVEQVGIALEAMLAGVRPPDGVQPLTGIRELYHLLSGDYEMSGVFQPDRVYLANVTSSVMAGLVANRLNKRVINLFQQYPAWWAQAVTIQDFATLQDVRWITLGGVGELPTVAEGAAYTELTWDDLTETASFVKKGGYLGITLEAIDKDDTRRLTAAPQALAQSAWLTLSKSISAIFTDASGTGPTLADAVVLFHAGSHSNLGSSALSVAAWKATKIAMMKQTEVHSAERLGALTAPKLLWVPVDLEDQAVVVLASANEPDTADNDINPYAQGEGRVQRLSNARSRVITVPLWTDTDNWAAQADPQLYPSIGLGFRYGRTPEIFSVADPRAGLMFSNDVMPVKVRFLYAVGPTDYRGLYKHNL